MDAFIEFMLIAVTLGAAILGTVSNPGGRIKIALISLAILTSFATAVKSWSGAQESKINKKLIATLVQASNPPEYFSHDLVKGFKPLLEKSGQYVTSQQILDSTGERIFLLADKNNEEEISGAIFMSKKAMEPVYYAYAVDTSIGPALEKILNFTWQDCLQHWNSCINELAAFSRLATEVAPINITETTANMDSEQLTFSLESREYYNGAPIRIDFSREFIESLYGLSAQKRGLKILDAAQLAIIENLN